MADRTVQINSFKYGLDTRREALASLPGTLQTAQNVAVDPGGEINKRKAFVPVDSANIKLPAGCFGLQDTDSGLMTFGSIATPAGLPAGVVYQQLVYPSSPAPGQMAAILFTCAFQGKPFVLANFDNSDAVFGYYNGVVVAQITDGIIKPSPGGGGIPETNSDLSKDLAAIVNRIPGWLADPNVTALPYNGVADNQDWQQNLGYLETALTGSTLVMSPPGVHFTPTIVNNNSVAGLIGAKLIDQGYPGVAALAASVAFSLNAGTNGTVTVTAPAKADGTGTAAVSGGAVNFNTSLGQTAQDIATAINNNTFLTGYSAQAVSSTATITVFAPVSFGAFQNVTPHALIVDTTGNITTVGGNPQSYLVLTILVGNESLFNPDTAHAGVRTLNAQVSGAVGTVTFTWSPVSASNVDIPNPSPTNLFSAQYFLSALTGPSVTAYGVVIPGSGATTGRFRCTATDAGSGKSVTTFFTVLFT